MKGQDRQRRGRSGGARDNKRGRPRKDPRTAPPFSNLEKFSKSYSKLLKKDFQKKKQE